MGNRSTEAHVWRTHAGLCQMGHPNAMVVLPGNKRIYPFFLKDFKRTKDDTFASAQKTEGWKESNLTWQEFGQSLPWTVNWLSVFFIQIISQTHHSFSSPAIIAPPPPPSSHTHHLSPSSIPIFSKAFSIPMSHFVKPFRDLSLISGGGFWTCLQGLLQLHLGSLSPLTSRSSLMECLAVP